MAKKLMQDREIKVREQLARAQDQLQRAQQKRALVGVQGEHEVERARQRAAARLTRATMRVERHAARVSRTEAKLSEVRQSEQKTPGERVPRNPKASANGKNATSIVSTKSVRSDLTDGSR